jgi:hypothetical protein
VYGTLLSPAQREQAHRTAVSLAKIKKYLKMPLSQKREKSALVKALAAR